MKSKNYAYLLIPALYYFAVALAWISIAIIVVNLGGDVKDYALVNLIYNATSAIFSSLLPRILAGIERRQALSISYIVLTFVYIYLYKSQTLIEVYIIHVFYGLASAMILSFQTPIFVEIFGRGKGISLMYIFSSIGWIISLALGGYLRSYITVKELMLLPAISSGICSIASLLLPKTVGVVEAQKMIAFRKLFMIVIERTKRFHVLAPQLVIPKMKARLKPIDLYLIASAMIFIAASMYFSALPIYLKKIVNVSDEELYYFSTVSGIASLTAYFIQLRLSENIEILLKLHITALGTRLLLFIAPLIIRDAIHYYPLYFALGITWGFIGSVQSHIIAYLAEPHRKDERFGHLNTSISIGLILGNLLASILSILGYEALFAVSSIIVGLLALFINMKCRIY